jgi:predicted transcriptional regulator
MAKQRGDKPWSELYASVTSYVEKSLKEKIRKAAKKANQTQSEWLEQAIRERLERK